MTERSSMVSPISLNEISFADSKPSREVYEMACPESKIPHGRYYERRRLYLLAQTIGVRCCHLYRSLVAALELKRRW